MASWGSSASAKRAPNPALVPLIDAAVARTAGLVHYFWTGTLPPFRGREDSVEPNARDQAMRLGGTTLEDTIAGIDMPLWVDQTQEAIDTWTYASNRFANATRGVAYVFRGEMTRDGNIFDSQVRPLFSYLHQSESLCSPFKEFPNLQNNENVTAVYQINVHLTTYDEPFQIYTAVQTPASTTLLLVS